MPRGGRASTPTEAFLLAGVGGCVDAIGLLTLGGLFVSHMSGNTAAMGELFGQGHWSAGWPHLFAVPVFVAGLFLGYWWAGQEVNLKRSAAILFLEAGLLGAFAAAMLAAGYPAPGHSWYFLLATLPLLAMGMQNATLRVMGRSAFPSTYVTGVLDRFAQCCAEYVRARGTAGAGPAWSNAVSALGIWLSYAAGALAGGAGLLLGGASFLVAPSLILLVLGFRLLRMARRPAG